MLFFHLSFLSMLTAWLYWWRSVSPPHRTMLRYCYDIMYRHPWSPEMFHLAPSSRQNFNLFSNIAISCSAAFFVSVCSAIQMFILVIYMLIDSSIITDWVMFKNLFLLYSHSIFLHPVTICCCSKSFLITENLNFTNLQGNDDPILPRMTYNGRLTEARIFSPSSLCWGPRWRCRQTGYCWIWAPQILRDRSLPWGQQ